MTGRCLPGYDTYRFSINKAWLGAARASYAFSKRSWVYATVCCLGNGGNQLSTMVGIKHVF